ncbi:unnamed protein product [Blepharisma stoltei]|uniref:Uncharacterized protein n=1 Tax=Blepharisma stoltei TaxID=1481888 RepID=A0AAU9JWK6_9CILI|nr:unnamed protein product [Blepharisma stoltei]
MQSVSDGRIHLYKPGTLERNEDRNSIVLQALETGDGELLDWCIENMQAPLDVPDSLIAHLIYFLAGRFWVHSDPKALGWIRSTIVNNKEKIKGNQEIRLVLDEVNGKLKAKAAGIEEVGKLKNKLDRIFTQNKAAQDFAIIEQPQIIINEENDMDVED